MILLDTHTWIWWMNVSDKLTNEAQEAITRSNRIGIHVISCFEIAILAEKNKITLSKPVEDWVSASLSHPKIEIIPLSVSAAITCTQLPSNFHRDPVDRMLAAACLLNDYSLITKDREIAKRGYIETVWD
jgi:PIN domain nuclease of toxin-antitoxin system